MFVGKVRQLSYTWARVIRQHAAADNARMKTLIRHARQACTALLVGLMSRAKDPKAFAPLGAWAAEGESLMSRELPER